MALEPQRWPWPFCHGIHWWSRNCTGSRINLWGEVGFSKSSGWSHGVRRKKDTAIRSACLSQSCDNVTIESTWKRYLYATANCYAFMWKVRESWFSLLWLAADPLFSSVAPLWNQTFIDIFLPSSRPPVVLLKLCARHFVWFPLFHGARFLSFGIVLPFTSE